MCCILHRGYFVKHLGFPLEFIPQTVTLLQLKHMAHSQMKIFINSFSICITLINTMDVSEFFYYDKIFHWKNLVFDFYFVNFLVAKKTLFLMIFFWKGA